MKKKVLNLIKLIAGLSILAYIVFFKTNPAKIIEVLSDTSLPLVIISFLLYPVGIYVSAVRWKLILNDETAGYTVSDLFKSYLVSIYFSLFLPKFGSDVVRIADTRNTDKGLAKSTAVVLVERLSGVFVLILFSVIATIIKFDFIKNIPQAIYPVILFVIGSVVFFIVWKILPDNFFERFTFKISFIDKIFSKLAKLHYSIQEALGDRKILLKATCYSVLLQLNVIIHYYLIGLALNIDIPLISYFYMMPILLLALSFPISTPNGVGLKEFIVAKLFASYSYTYAHAVSFSLLDTTGNILLGIIGCYIYLSRKK